MNNLRISIDRIVVEGLPASEQARFAASLRSRLEALGTSGIADRFAPGQKLSLGNLDAGRFGGPVAHGDQAAARVVDNIRQSIVGASAGGRHV